MERLTNFREQDAITQVLRSVSVDDVTLFRSKLRAPWAFSVLGHGITCFHIVTRGSCWLWVGSDADAVKLVSGDLVILTRGHDHFIGDDPKTSPKLLDLSLVKRLVAEANTFRNGENGRTTELICGGFLFSDVKLNPLLSALPKMIYIKGHDGRPVPWLQTTLKFIADEAKTNRPGVESVITRLSDILFIQAVRAFLATQEGQRMGWLRALKDPQVGRAMNLIHREAEFPWTVQSLGARVGMSRSVFADHFRSLVGESPLHYLARWRLNSAAILLKTSDAKLAEVAKRVGYESEYTFSRAFKRATGFPPGAYRRSETKYSDDGQKNTELVPFHV